MPRAAKDPNKPKGRVSAYAFYVADRKAKAKAAGEAPEFGAFSKLCAEDWKDLTPEEKEPFEDKAAEDKQRYEREMQAYTPDSKGGRRGRKKKDKNAPKRALSGFMHFCGVKRPGIKAANPKYTVGELAKELGIIWKGMSEKEKVPYEEMAKKDRDRYEKDMELYRKGQYNAGAGADDDIDEDEESD